MLCVSHKTINTDICELTISLYRFDHTFYLDFEIIKNGIPFSATQKIKDNEGFEINPQIVMIENDMQFNNTAEENYKLQLDNVFENDEMLTDILQKFSSDMFEYINPLVKSATK